MEDRTISLNAVLDLIPIPPREEWTKKDCRYDWVRAMRDMVSELESVEPKRETGYWKVVPSYDKYGEYRPHKYACSKCGWTVDLCRGLQQEEGYKLFCEHCGTDLRKRRF